MGSAVIFSGSDVKTLKSSIDLFGGAKLLSIAVDPTAVATSAPKGSVALSTSTGFVYRKTDAGSTVNWVNLSASSANQYYAVIAASAIAGFSTATTFASGLSGISDGKEVYAITGSYTEDVTTANRYKVTGQGYDTVLDGNLVFSTGSSRSEWRDLRVTGNVTINSGVSGVELWLSGLGGSWIDNSGLPGANMIWVKP